MSEYSILDKLITQRHAEEIRSFDPVSVVVHLLGTLTPREAEVVRHRFAVPDGGQTETLEEIGKKLQVTRERVRQITKSSVGKLQALRSKHDELKLFIRTTEYLLRSHGGALESEYFINQLLHYSHTSGDASTQEIRTRACLHFLLDNLLEGFVERRVEQQKLRTLYVLTGVDTLLLQGAVGAFLNVVEPAGVPLQLTELLRRYRQQPYYIEHKRQLVAEPVHIAREFLSDPNVDEEPTAAEEDGVLTAYLAASGDLSQNIFGEWGKQSWPTIRPRRMNDKIYLILRHEGKPLHFSAITEKINGAHFDAKVAKAPSVHNELILDKRFVLVGRGLYALREWGYQPGTVGDVVRELLVERKSLTREEIVSEVLRKRMVKKQTIHLALLNQSLFVKGEDGRYSLVSSKT
ncbi:MAG: sigma factor-like helix-turn-helix DNA-binding protein [Patescibacteria group bacterium]|jgi:hypothetical protein